MDALIATERVVVLRVTLVDIAGDLASGLLLSQILFWHPRATIHRDGRSWIAKAPADWWEEIRLTSDQVRRATKVLRDGGLIETGVWKFAGTPTTHISVCEEAMEQALAALDPTWATAQVDLGQNPSRLGPQPESYRAEQTAKQTAENYASTPRTSQKKQRCSEDEWAIRIRSDRAFVADELANHASALATLEAAVAARWPTTKFAATDAIASLRGAVEEFPPTTEEVDWDAVLVGAADALDEREKPSGVGTVVAWACYHDLTDDDRSNHADAPARKERAMLTRREQFGIEDG